MMNLHHQLMLGIIICSTIAAVKSCSNEWFGEFCQYKCHCENNTCLPDGSCNGTLCENGWFGYMCQYQNLIEHSNNWLADEDDSTCNTDNNLKHVSTKLTSEFYFTWLRLNFKEQEPIRQVSLEFNTTNSVLPCLHQKLILVNNSTIDVWCSLNVTIRQIDMNGEGVRALCSLYVSGGRNVALKQPTHQSSTLLTYKGTYYYNISQSLNVVDGNNDANYFNGSCSHTELNDASPTWRVTFNETFRINRFVIYNRVQEDIELRDRLKHFILHVYGDNRSMIFNYTDSNDTPMNVYTVNSLIKESAEEVTITATYSKELILSLCEVEIYGDCPEGKIGLQCNQTCNQESNVCNSVCNGFTDPPNCTVDCPIGSWGLNCVNNCIGQCWESNCYKQTGLCLSGCHGYMDPPYCTRVDSSCSSEWFGEYCQYKCHCENKPCLPDGSCGSDSCESGWFGFKCQYRNLIMKDTDWLTDEDDATCNTNKNIKTVSSQQFDNYLFTWLRLIFKENEPIRYFSIQFYTSNNTDVPCLDQKLTLVVNKTLDVWCSLNITVQRVNITGEGVTTLCSLYVSGGRNVALKQPTMQTSTYVKANNRTTYSLSLNAVDGNTNSSFNSSSCTHTAEKDTSPTWTVTFNKTFTVKRFVLYNRNDSDDQNVKLSERLKHFSLWVLGDTNTVLINYTDQDNISKPIYTINSFSVENATKVSIAARNNSKNFYLTLCEVQIFGDCPEGKKGLECNETFDKENDMVCFGYNDPPKCTTKCPVGTWGLNCVNNCTDQCWNSNCNRDNGLCLSECHGLTGPTECTKYMKFAYCISILFFTIFTCADETANISCPDGWFGKYCQYKCHCQNNACLKDGSCNSVSCESGWFGLACQYVNMVKHTDNWLMDENDTTCNDQDSTNVSIQLTTEIYFTWLKLTFKEKVPINGFVLGLNTHTSVVLCQEQQLYIANKKNNTLDVWCSLNVSVHQININGEGVRTLCSIYVSGGRNVALKQPTYQTSTYTDEKHNISFSQSLNAVDGNTSGKFSDQSCTHTKSDDTSPTWTVKFNETFMINRFILYNRGNSEENSMDEDNKSTGRLANFKLKAFDQNSLELFNYTDNNNTEMIYPVISFIRDRVSNVSITATTNLNVKILTLCEVQIFGDCSEGERGLECEQRCDKDNNNCNRVCLGSSDPPQCGKNCSDGFWGLDCTNNCAERCVETKCDNINGFCISGCKGYSDPPYCTQACQSDKWGVNCSQSCSPNCITSTCHRLTGVCQYGCSSGFIEPQCNKACSHGNWGMNCTHNCNTGCYQNNCSNINGSCLQGCLGFSNPPDCTLNCTSDHWGLNCNKTCSHNCLNKTCNSLDGKCLCSPGFFGDWCKKECQFGQWGLNCANDCKAKCVNGNCSKDNGMCLDGCIGFSDPPNCKAGCAAGFYGVNCKTSCPSSCESNNCTMNDGKCYNCLAGYEGSHCEQVSKKEDDTTNLGVIVGPIIAALLLICLIVLGVMLWRRRRNVARKKDAGFETHNVYDRSLEEIPTKEERNKKDAEKSNTNTSPPDLNGGYYNTVELKQDTSIHVSDFNHFMTTHKRPFFTDQFNKIPAPVKVSMEIANSDKNKNKNRYKNICSYDHSRVILNINPEKNEDNYINASYIKGFNNEFEFVASQGPNVTILNDFVRMLWEQKAEKVVMLTNLIEEGKIKCDKYWPDEGRTNFGDIKVRLVTTFTYSDYTIRKLELIKKNEDTHHLVHYQFHAWPDKGVPDSTWSLVDFANTVSGRKSSGVTVVHCSAGVGRTGTFIALLNILAQARETKKMNFLQIVAKLRQDRVFMVQTPLQYEFLHKVAQASLLCMDTPADDLTSGPHSGNTMTRKKRIEEEFKNVCTVCSVVNQEEKVDEDNGENVYQNTQKISMKDKNRFPSVSTSVRFRPFLKTANDITDDYINAVIVQGLKQRDQYFLSQLPMSKTVDDFWRLVTQYKINVVVSFEHGEIKTDKSIVKYLPDQKEKELETPLFKLSNDAQHKSTLLWDEQRLTVTCKDETYSEKHNVIILQASFKDLTAKKWLEFLRHVKKCYSPSGKVVYICKNGAQFSGLACALSLVLERMDSEMKVNIPLVVGSLKLVRPEVIATVDQYRLIYEVLHLCNENSNQYTSVGDRSLKEIL